MNYNMEKFKNITVALNTPFKESGEVDLEKTRELVNYLYNKGIKSLYVCGSTGEGFLLDNEERKSVVEAVCEEVKDKMTIIVHVGCASTKHSCELAKHAGECGAHATSAVPSVYYRLGEESVYTHWSEITKASDLPFFIYNIPQLTGFNLSDGLLRKMCENEKVKGVKCSSDPAHDIGRYKAIGGDDFLVFNGPDEQYLAGRMMGADAGIGGTYAGMPELYLKLEDLIRRNEYDKAKKLQAIMLDYVYRMCSFGSLYGCVKSLIKLDGLDIGIPRLPFLPVSSEDDKLVQLHKDIKNTIEETKCW
ncbi:dihydrodipicolinate synthase family protein [Romboutsia sp.]|uniref:dihydrodipicolinate synthase family protein n=1 Tax=Romboutsia sp. TaxID=1965302 RepID=UPI003F2F8B17